MKSKKYEFPDWNSIKDEFLHQAKALQNDALLQKVMRLSGGDDYYERGFTLLGELEYKVYYEELRSRLKDWLLQ